MSLESVRTTVLVAAGADGVLPSLARALENRGYLPLAAPSGRAALDAARSADALALALLALPLPDMTARVFTQQLAQHHGCMTVLMGTDAEVTNASDAFDLGAYDYIEDVGVSDGELLAVIGAALGSRSGDMQLRYLREKEASGSSWNAIVGRSNAFKNIIGVLRQVCRRTSSGGTPTILLGGETGTGKGFIARCIHYNGARRHRPFVSVNCAALPPALMESELFGHERGAFTDAKSQRNGLFETAAGGTLFLDEIAAMPLDLQAKLLTSIEDKEIRRIGGRRPIRVDVQIIAATHEDLATRMRLGTFRTDLYHRLNVVSLTIPALRERAEDILPLAERFMRDLCADYGMPPRAFKDDARDWMLDYAWPGNVRELRNQIERIVLLENDDVIRAGHFRMPSGNPRVDVALDSGRLTVELPRDGVSLELLEREVLREALTRCDGNVSRTARYLSISRHTLIYRMKKFGL